MNMKEEILVKTIWSEMVKPFHPTPPHLNTFKLSLFDQMFLLVHNSTILFYGSWSSSFRDPDHLMMTLKASLSKTLSQFYPFAGRLIDNSTLICNDEGVLLTHTQVTCTLKTYLSLITTTSSMNHLSKLLPSKESLHGSHQHQPIPISAWLQLAFQVNVFECGGVVLGCTKNHKLLDAASLVTFLQHWAGSCLGLDPEYLIQPNFDIATTFPPNSSGYPPPTAIKSRDFFKEQLQKAYTNNSTSIVTCKVFLFEAAVISSLRSIDRSRIESVLGFLWKHCARAEEDKDENCPTSLILTTNIRPWGHPPLPRESMGNIGTHVMARAEKNGSGFAHLVSEAICELKNGKLVREIEGEALAKHNYMIVKEGVKPSTYQVSCQCKVGITDVDFGLGKPVLVCPFNGIIVPFLKNIIFLMDHGNNGIMAWVFLDEKHMHNLETNPDFLAFASPFDPETLF